MTQRYIGGLIYNPPGGYSGYFDGTGDRLSLATATAFGTGSNTVEFWFFPTDSSATYRSVYDSRSSVNTDTGYGIFQYGLTIEVYGNGLKVATAANAFAINTWTHVALVRNSGTCQLYINGTASGASATYSANLTSTVRVIGDSVNTVYPFVGYISNLREVTSAVYTAAFTPPNGPLQNITNTSLLTCRYPTFVDGSSNAFTITVNGNTTVSTQNPFPLTTLPNPAQGGAGNGIFSMSQYQSLKQQNLWPTVDPYFRNTTLLLHGNGTNGGQNNTFLDSGTANSGSGFTITRNGDTTQGTFSPFSVGAGYWSAFFAGGASGGYITSSTSADYTFGTGDFTIEGFVFVTGTGTGIFQQATSNFPLSTTNTVALGTNGGTPTWQMYAKNTSTNSTATWAANNWYHFAVVRSGTTTTLYINGSSVITVTGDSTNYTGTNFGIGSIYGTGSSERFTGYLSNLRVVKGAAVYTANFTPPTSPLTSFGSGTTALIALQSNRYIDTSASPKTLTVTGDTSVQAFSPFAPTAAYSASTVGGSGYFDGSGDVLSIADAAALELGSSDFCVEGWYYPLSFSANLVLVGKRANTTSTGAFIIYANSGSGALTFYASTNGSTYFWSGATVGTMVLNQWNHFAVYRSGNNWYGSINGVVSSMGTSSNSIYNDAESWRIGGDSNGNYANGYIASTRIVIGSAVYGASNFTPPTAPLTNITNTSLLCNFTNAAIIDNTANNDLVTFGNAQISTAQSKFGGGSILFNGTTDFIYGGLGQTWNFLTGPFTVECWIYFNSVASGYVFSNANSSGNLSNGMTLYLSSSGTLTLYGPSVSGTATTSVSTGQWYHLAVTRSGNTFYLFKDGVQQGTFTDSGSITGTDSSRYFGIGRSASYSAAGWLSAYIDEFRITKGIARYTSNFTPQTSQWQDQ